MADFIFSLIVFTGVIGWLLLSFGYLSVGFEKNNSVCPQIAHIFFSIFALLLHYVITSQPFFWDRLVSFIYSAFCCLIQEQLFETFSAMKFFLWEVLTKSFNIKFLCCFRRSFFNFSRTFASIWFIEAPKGVIFRAERTVSYFTQQGD